MSEEMVTITKLEYDELLEATLKLDCLEEGGVDNWEWYDEAMKLYEERKEGK